MEEKLQESQYGFRPGRGTSDLIFTVKMILEKSWEWDISRVALFIDMGKAFDRGKNDLFNIMLESRRILQHSKAINQNCKEHVFCVRRKS